MIALPLFWDQYDNAQRVAETGYGIRLQTYEFEDGELLGAIDRLRSDHALRERMTTIAARVQSAPGTVKAADLVERLARDGAPVIG
jgi:UDP:flavonoid glycosyltransferase YjiC (YdhE family)